MAPRSADVLVAGAGPAGATAARLLAGKGVRVVLADALPRPCDRLEILSPAVRPLLQATGSLDLMDDPVIARQCLGIRRSWGAAGLQVEDFLRHAGGTGHVIERSAFDAALRRRAAQAGALFVRERVARVRRLGSGFVATLSGICEVRAAALVDATGRPAALVRRLGASRIVLARQTAARSFEPHLAEAWSPDWLEVNGSAGRWSYCVTGPGGRSEAWTLPGGVRRGGGNVVDASSARLDGAAGRGWAAAGDAAACFDPVTSQGLANALSTALVVAGMILDRGIGADAARFYADAVTATHARSEAARIDVYRALDAPAAAA